jgi:hypothetical protein
LIACGLSDTEARTAVANVCEAKRGLTAEQHTFILDGVNGLLLSAKNNFTPWAPSMRSTDYLANKFTDRDTQNVRLQTSGKVSNNDSKAAYKPGRTKDEDLFSNQVVTPQAYSIGQRFIAPTTQTMQRAHANKYDSFQA